MLNNRLDPLSIVVPIVDKEGRPTLEFQRKWQQQIAANATIPDLSKISVLAGSGLTGGGPLTANVTLAADVQAVLNQLAASQGTLVYKGASKWEILTPGTDAQVLTTHGAAANPTWEDAAPTVPALTDGHILVGNGSNLAADVAMSGDATIDNTGAVTVGANAGWTLSAAGLVQSIAGGGQSHINILGEGFTQQNFAYYGSSTTPAVLALQRGRGTIAARTVPVLNDALGRINFSGWDGSSNTVSVQFQSKLIETGTVGPSAMGAQLQILCCPIGSGTLAEDLRIRDDYQALKGPVKIGAIAAPAASAVLDIQSTTQGVLSPRMTTTQRNAISTPADGLEVYDTTLHAKFVNYNGVWTQLGAASTGANPTATGSDTATNGSATTFMRSDASFAIQKASDSVFGLAKVDNVTITASGGVITATGFTPLAAAFHPGYLTGQFYSIPLITTGAAAPMSTGTIYAHLFYVGLTTTFSKIAIKTSGAAGVNIELGVYANTNAKPGALLYDAGQVSVAASGPAIITGLSMLLTPGWYWLVASSSGAVTATGYNATGSAASGPLYHYFGVANLNGIADSTGYTGSWTYSAGALPSTFPTATLVTSVIPQVWVAP